LIQKITIDLESAKNTNEQIEGLICRVTEFTNDKSIIMENAAESRTVRLPVFGGAHADFQVWWTRFMAFAAVHKFTQALKVGGETNLPAKEDDAIDVSTDVGKLQSAAVRRNAVAMANLTMAFTSEATINLVHKAMTAEWPTGLAHLAVAAMFKKHRPQDAITKVELRQALNNIKMKKGKDPATPFEQICSIENKCNTATKKIDEDDLIAVVLDAAPSECQALLTSEQCRLGVGF
jgi:hypothetical protein